MSTNVVLTKFLSKFSTIDFYKEIINISLYPADFTLSIGSSRENSVPDYINKFFNDVNRIFNQYNHEQKKNVSTFIDAAKTILKLRNAGVGFISYDTINQHFHSKNALVKKLIQTTIQERIENENDFRKKIDGIVSQIDYFYDFQKAIAGMTQIQQFLDLMEKDDVSIIEAVENYKDMSLQLNADLSKLSTVSRDETAVDYYVLSDVTSVDTISQSVIDYIYDNYTFYRTGLEAYDRSVDGFESSSVHLIMSPSNGGKSVTLANLFYKLAQENTQDFTENDAALFISCEDDLIKTARKFISIFGNYSYGLVRDLFKQIYEVFNTFKKKNGDNIDEESIKDLKNQAKKIFFDLLNNSVVKTTKGNLKIIFKYSPENSLSASDIAKQLEKYKLQKINIKYLIVDYLDTLKASSVNAETNDYDKLGFVTQELRSLSRLFAIPVIAATQTNKEAEKINVDLSNYVVGESWKKVKFSDFIYGQRIRDDLSIFSDEVVQYIFKKESDIQPSSSIVQMHKEKLLEVLKPMEFRVTKSKEKGKGSFRFMLFCPENLRLYNYVEDYLSDMPNIAKNNANLEIKINEFVNSVGIMPEIDFKDDTQQILTEIMSEDPF